MAEEGGPPMSKLQTAGSSLYMYYVLVLIVRTGMLIFTSSKNLQCCQKVLDVEMSSVNNQTKSLPTQ